MEVFRARECPMPIPRPRGRDRSSKGIPAAIALHSTARPHQFRAQRSGRNRTGGDLHFRHLPTLWQFHGLLLNMAHRNT